MVIIFHDKHILPFFVLEADNDDKNGVVWMEWLQVKALDAKKRDHRVPDVIWSNCGPKQPRAQKVPSIRSSHLPGLFKQVNIADACLGITIVIDPNQRGLADNMRPVFGG